mgnify:FL=1|tara:strand:+ start:159 stop:428 length:270 start_codon:yes stop_codon:yes gene_type:complete
METMTMNRESITKSLREGVCEVFFTKSDGSERIMHCTLNPKFAPSMPQQVEETVRKNKNPDAIAVWDTDFDAWRSFRIDRIMEFNGKKV